MIKDSLLEKLTFETHTGPDIVTGGKVPDIFGSRALPKSKEFFVEGPARSGVLNAVHRPILANTGGLKLRMNLATNAAAYTVAGQIELDTRLSFAKSDYNFSSQVNYDKNGMFQIIKNGVWTDVYPVGRFEPYILYPIEFSYRFDVIAKRFSFISADFGVGLIQILPSLQNFAAGPLLWEDRCSLQVQLNLGAQPGAFQVYIDHAEYEWS